MNYLIKKLFPFLIIPLLVSSHTAHSMNTDSSKWLGGGLLLGAVGGVSITGYLMKKFCIDPLKSRLKTSNDTVQKLETAAENNQTQIENLKKTNTTQNETITAQANQIKVFQGNLNERGVQLQTVQTTVGKKDKEIDTLKKKLPKKQDTENMIPVIFSLFNKTPIFQIFNETKKVWYGFQIMQGMRYTIDQHHHITVDNAYKAGDFFLANGNHVNYGINEL